MVWNDKTLYYVWKKVYPEPLAITEEMVWKDYLDCLVQEENRDHLAHRVNRAIQVFRVVLAWKEISVSYPMNTRTELQNWAESSKNLSKRLSLVTLIEMSIFMVAIAKVDMILIRIVNWKQAIKVCQEKREKKVHEVKQDDQDDLELFHTDMYNQVQSRMIIICTQLLHHCIEFHTILIGEKGDEGYVGLTGIDGPRTKRRYRFSGKTWWNWWFWTTRRNWTWW